MKRRNAPCAWVMWIALPVTLAATDVAAASDRASRRHPPDPALTSAPIVSQETVDGTPRPGAAVIVNGPLPGAGGRYMPPPTSKGGPVTSMSTFLDRPGMADPLGGDDVRVWTEADNGNSFRPRLQITSGGTLFIAMETTSGTTQTDVYKSIDGGETWTLWSTFAPVDYEEFGDFSIAEGVVNRAFIAYKSTANTVRIAYADPAAAVPTWTVVTALNPAGVSFGTNQISIETDAFAFDDYYVYVVAPGFEFAAEGIWFSRSLNQGASYVASFEFATGFSGNPLVCVDAAGVVHTAFARSTVVPTDFGLSYRRATNYGAGPWDPELVLDAFSNGIHAFLQSIGTHPNSGTAIILARLDGVPKCRYSTDFGVTWPGTNSVDTGFDNASADAIVFPPGQILIAGLNDAVANEMIFMRTGSGNPALLGAPERISTFDSPAPGGGSIAYDATRGNRVAVAFEYVYESQRYVRFDAEWRRDPGYPNTEVGFPIQISGGGQTPPAIAEVDGDAKKEIVFGTITGDIHVIKHDGTSAPGWPVNIGSMPFDAPVAIGDLVGNGQATVVAGNTTGQVYAFEPDGSIAPGWPVDLQTGAPVYVSIGALGPPHKRYVVAVSLKKVTVLNYAGVNVSPAWSPPEIPFGTYSRPAAIGDVDDDGITDIVSVAGPNLYFHQLGVPGYQGQHFAGETFSDAPTLADIDNDGDLEIAAPTASGKMILYDRDSGHVPGWPITVSPGVALTSAAMANFLGTPAVELAFAQATGPVHVLYTNGAEQGGYPQTATAPVFMPPILYPVNTFVSNVNIADISGTARSWRNIPSIAVPGWPRNLGGAVEETLAAGDIDNDDRIEIVVLGTTSLTVFDVNNPPPIDARTYWPMYGHDAQRTGCLDCPEDFTAVGDSPSALKIGLDVHPNPFNPATTITYDVAAPGPVALAVYDVRGARVETLIDGEHRAAGRYSLSYSPRFASGVYFLRLVTGAEEISRKMVLLK